MICLYRCGPRSGRKAPRQRCQNLFMSKDRGCQFGRLRPRRLSIWRRSDNLRRLPINFSPLMALCQRRVPARRLPAHDGRRSAWPDIRSRSRVSPHGALQTDLSRRAFPDIRSISSHRRFSDHVLALDLLLIQLYQRPSATTQTPATGRGCAVVTSVPSLRGLSIEACRARPFRIGPEKE